MEKGEENRTGKENSTEKEKYKYLKERIGKSVLSKLEQRGELNDEEIKELIYEQISAREFAPALDVKQRWRLARELFFSIRRLDILQELLDDESVTEIMINGMDGIFVEKNGRLSRWDGCFESREKLEDVIQQMVAGCNRVVNEASPIVDARLKDGSRVNVVLAPTALNGPIVTIRRFSGEPMSMERLVQLESLDREVCDFLRKLVISGYNIFISGGTGSGKTTFLNALSGCLPPQERVITIEDSAELQLIGMENLVRLETRNANVEGCKPITIRDLIRTSLRMRPDRIIVGEVRGGEAIDMMQALNCGHDGSMSTGHANSAKDMLSRLETMALMGMDLPLPAIRRQIASALDIIIHLGRLRDKSRKVLEIVEVDGMEDGEIRLHPLYVFQEEKKEGWEKHRVRGRLVKQGEMLHTEKMAAAGF